MVGPQSSIGIIEWLTGVKMENHYTVYKLTDPEGKIYIGCTGKTVEERWHKGRGYPKGLPIREAIDRYGWENFTK